jgi:hypothetical protein
VVSSAVVRGTMTAMNWFFRPPNRQVAVATFDEGVASCIEALRVESVALPPALETALREPRPYTPSRLLHSV